jgi:hypothetical protein
LAWTVLKLGIAAGDAISLLGTTAGSTTSANPEANDMVKYLFHATLSVEEQLEPT